MSKRVLTAGLAIVFALAIAEAALRIWAPLYTIGIPGSYQYDPEVGYLAKPAIHMLQTTDYQQEVRTNPLGTMNFQDDFRGHGVLIFALGDSYTQGAGLPPDASYPFQLDLILNLDANGVYSKRYGVVNLGLAAYGGEQSLLLLRRYAERLGKPGIVLYLGSENDYQDDLLFQGGFRHRHLVDGNPHWGWLLRPLRWVAATELGKRGKMVLGRLRERRAVAGSPAPAATQSVAELEGPVLQRIATACHDYGALLIVSWSSPGDSYHWLKSWAAARGVAFADWSPAVESVQVAIPSLPMDNPHSGGHHRAWVMRIVAEEFARKIRAGR